MEGKAAGTCLCGSVAFMVDLPTLWCAHCHCSMCRRAHGAGYVTWVGVPQERFRITGGETLLSWYQSSPAARRGFCGQCGSTLFFASERWAGEMHIVRASFTSDIDREPQAHVYFDDRADWIRIDDTLPRRGGESGTEPR